MRITQLDGLRGIAILMVLLFHHEFFNAGWMGVDLFFCLSGFLITTILRRDRGRESYWKPFYLKRATRILPPFLLVLASCFAVSKHMKWIALLGYGFFGAGVINLTRYYVPELMMLWSLAIEEHFYFVWPGFVRNVGRRHLITGLLLMIAASPLLRLAAEPFTSWYFLYFLTPFHLDGMLLGCLLALLVETSSGSRLVRRYSVAAIVGGIAGAILAHIVPGSARLYPVLVYSCIGIASAGIVGHLFLEGESWFSRALQWKPLVWLGSISYGVYLYQQLVISVMARIFHDSYPYKPGALHHLFLPDVLVTLGLSWLSFLIMEKPMMAWGHQRAKATTAFVPEECSRIAERMSA